MYLIVVGAGSIGTSLISLAVEEGHDVALIEKNEQRIHEALEQFDILGLHADIAQNGILAEAGADKADALVATTSDDASNLMAIFLGQECGIKTLVSIVNERDRSSLFKRLDAHVLVDPEKILARNLYNTVHNPYNEEILSLSSGEQVFEVTVTETSSVVGKSIGDILHSGEHTEDFVILSLRRDDDTSILPAKDTTIEENDHLVIFSPSPLKEAQCKPFME